MPAPTYADVFADMGKIIAIFNDLDSAGPTVETDIVEMVEQLDRNYENVKILPTLINNAVAARSSMSSGGNNMVSGMDTYLLNPLKTEMSSTATTASGVLAELRAFMVTDSQTVLLSGVFWDFFWDNYAQSLNHVISGQTISDTLAT